MKNKLIILVAMSLSSPGFALLNQLDAVVGDVLTSQDLRKSPESNEVGVKDNLKFEKTFDLELRDVKYRESTKGTKHSVRHLVVVQYSQHMPYMNMQRVFLSQGDKFKLLAQLDPNSGSWDDPKVFEFEGFQFLHFHNVMLGTGNYHSDALFLLTSDDRLIRVPFQEPQKSCENKVLTGEYLCFDVKNEFLNDIGFSAEVADCGVVGYGKGGKPLATLSGTYSLNRQFKYGRPNFSFEISKCTVIPK